MDAWPRLRREYDHISGTAERAHLMPDISTPDALRPLLGLEAITVHAVPASEPYLGAGFSCPWDEEHGVGVLCVGHQPLEVNTADVAGDVAAVQRHHAKAPGSRKDTR